MKGAPERIYGRCSKILINGEEVKITQAHDDAFEKANKFFGGQGERVLAFARVYLNENEYPKDY
jgi:sodium/potassium-transporting ATPase subunit alpha